MGGKVAARILLALAPGPLDFVGLLVALRDDGGPVKADRVNAALGRLIGAGAVEVDREGEVAKVRIRQDEAQIKL